MMARKVFHHPFTPYDIQHDFMEAMYDCIEAGQVGIFESPTGTGKSLSLICSSLTWLREHKRKAFDEALAAVCIDDDEPEWMLSHARQIKQQELRQMRAEFESRLAAVRERERKLRAQKTPSDPVSKRRKAAEGIDGVEAGLGDEAFVLDDYDSDDTARTVKRGTQDYSQDTKHLMEQLGMLQSDHPNDTAFEVQDELKVYFCSRTHSQLSQFVGELQRVHLPPSLPPDGVSGSSVGEPNEHLKQLSLGSRKQLCINPKVVKLHAASAVNERCIELQQSSTPAESRCSFLPAQDSANAVLDFRDLALASMRDIEDLASVGKRLRICPYYASRAAIAPAEMVTLPYPLLLQKSAREALGISLKGNVVIIDESHNLMSAIEGICSVQIDSRQLERARESLMVYLQKFRNRLKGSNRVYVTQVLRVVDSMLSVAANLKNSSADAGALEPAQLLTGKAVDQVNLSKLVRYIGESKLARKVEGYAAFTAKRPEQTETERASEVPTLTHIQTFLATLNNPSKEGRFFWAREKDTTTLRYMLLDPSEHFRDIVEEARAVILAGGTMSPMDDYRQQLFPYLPAVTTFSCGHLIPPSSLLVRIVASDSLGRLEFNYKNRHEGSTPMRVWKLLSALAPEVKGGLVVLFPSYAFLEDIVKGWDVQNLTQQLSDIKPLFSDSRGHSADETFTKYSSAIYTGTRGAILLSVIGGKLSEGINFSDELGRCVVVVGLPFPNLETPEWKARMQYIDEKAVARGEPKGKASREHVENVCMRGVNQAIGRVIRHKNDWASVVLMDSRYAQTRIREKLPGWMKESCRSDASMESADVVKDVKSFFTLPR